MQRLDILVRNVFDWYTATNRVKRATCGMDEEVLTLDCSHKRRKSRDISIYGRMIVGVASLCHRPNIGTLLR
jgi:hypothetical protein